MPDNTSSSTPGTTKPVTDDDLLAKAIPIDEIDLEEADDDMPGLVDDGPVVVAKTPPAPSGGGNVAAQESTKIRRFETPRAAQRWARKTTITGNGAVHCKTFVAKMRDESLAHLDEQINEWLDSHPDVEVKFATTTVGRLQGKAVEDALVVNLWV